MAVYQEMIWRPPQSEMRVQSRKFSLVRTMRHLFVGKDVARESR